MLNLSRWSRGPPGYVRVAYASRAFASSEDDLASDRGAQQAWHMVGKFLKWGAVALGVVAVAALGFVGWVYAASEAHMRSFATPPAFAAAIPSDAGVTASSCRVSRCGVWW